VGRVAALSAGTVFGVLAALGSMSDACEPSVLLGPPPLARIAAAARVSTSDRDPPDLPEPDFAGKRPTPMGPRLAGETLAWAWHDVTGHRARAETVAVLWAHWALETGRGKQMVDFNFAGLKGRAPGGTSSLVWTRERTGDGKTRIRSRFRAYRSAEEGARDYVRTLHARFNGAFVAASEGDARGFAEALEDVGYFTEDPQAYRRAIESLAREYLSEVVARGVLASG